MEENILTEYERTYYQRIKRIKRRVKANLKMHVCFFFPLSFSASLKVHFGFACYSHSLLVLCLAYVCLGDS